MNGLARYDGYSFEYYSKRKNGERISGNWVYAITEDSSENMWIGTTEGLSKINTSEGKISNYSLSEHLTHKEVRALHVDDNQRVWIGTKLGLSIYDTQTGEIKKFSGRPFNNTINSIVQDTNGRVWMTCETGLISFNTLDLSYTYLPLQVNSNPYGDKMWTIYPVKNEIWLGTGGDGIFRFTSEMVGSLGKIGASTPKPEKIIDDLEVFDIIDDTKGSVWLATEKGLGKVGFSQSTLKVDFFNHLTSNDYSISSDQLFKLYFDSSQNLWIGSEMGLNVLLAKNLSFQNYNFDESTTIDAVRGITSVADSSLIITTSSRGTYSLAENHQLTKKISKNENNERLNLGRSITAIGQTVFIGTLNGVLVKDLSSRKEFHILSGKNIFSLAKDTLASKVYIGATDGLYAYDQRISKLITEKPIIKGFTRALHLSENDDLWVGVDGPEIFVKKKNSVSFRKITIPQIFTVLKLMVLMLIY